MFRILLFFVIVTTGWSESIRWYHDYHQALEEAKQQNKPVYLLLKSDHCPWCVKFKNETLMDPSVEKLLSHHFITVTIDWKDKNRPDTIRSGTVPTSFFLGPDGRFIIKPEIGFWESEEIASDLRYVLKKFKKRYIR
ncbi:thioredoxin family protein [Hydrogenimonas sp.]